MKCILENYNVHRYPNLKVAQQELPNDLGNQKAVVVNRPPLHPGVEDLVGENALIVALVQNILHDELAELRMCL